MKSHTRALILLVGLCITAPADADWCEDHPARDPRQAWWPESWAGDQTLTSAFQNSVVWFYQKIARRLGPETIATHLETGAEVYVFALNLETDVYADLVAKRRALTREALVALGLLTAEIPKGKSP